MLDADARALSRGEHLLHLTPKALDVLVVLAAERPRVVTKAALLDRVWPGTFVADGSVARTVHEIRDALGDAAEATIRTAHGHGYAFVADAVEVEQESVRAAAPAVEGPTRGWLVAGTRTHRLTDGELVIGRDPALAVSLDCVLASWRHACLQVDAERVTIVDLGSKNGTRLRGRPVTGPTALRDGDVIDIGTVQLTYRAGTEHPATSTKG